MESRPLGFAETFLHRFYTDLDAGLVTVVAAQLRAPISETNLREAISRVRLRHPLLRCTIVQDGDGFAFAETEAAPLTAIQQWDVDLTSLFERLLDQPFPDPSQLWEVGVSAHPNEPQVAYLKIHHAIADGTAARSLLLELLSPSNDSSEIEPLPLLPSVEQLMAKGSTTFDEPLPQPRQNADWKFEQKATRSDRTCRSILHKTDCRPILDSAHERKITVNSILMEVVLRNAPTLPQYPELSSLILPVSVRNRIQPGIEDSQLGCLIGNALVYAPDREALDSPRLGAILGRQLEHSMGTAITGPADFTPSMVKEAITPFADNDQDQFGFPLALSNVGALPSIEGVEALWFGASVKPGHLGILISASTIGKHLCLGFHYTEPLLSRKSVHAYAEAVMRSLTAISG